jgi:ABC-type Fe3+-siderophore transport system permease subunit
MKTTQTLVAAYDQTYAMAIVVLVAAAFLVRRYVPKDQDISYLASSGIQRGIPVNVAAFWLLIAAALAVAVAYVLRRL